MNDGDYRDNMTIPELIEEAAECLSNSIKDYVDDPPEPVRLLHGARSALWDLIEVIERQDARIAALEAARAPQGEK